LDIENICRSPSLKEMIKEGGKKEKREDTGEHRYLYRRGWRGGGT
jgi:hypothetical protein